jgi:hypothetical protein
MKKRNEKTKIRLHGKDKKVGIFGRSLKKGSIAAFEEKVSNSLIFNVHSDQAVWYCLVGTMGGSWERNGFINSH